MDKLIIKHASQSDSDLKELFKNNSKSPKYQRILYVKNSKQLSSILSSERLSLIFDLKESKNISQLVKQTGRKQEAISRDASLLHSAGIIKKTKKGRNVYLKTNIKKIEIDFS